jgi:2'-5' RNA ligase
MKYFVGIVPPVPIYEKVIEIQQQFGDNRLEPHITIRPPVALADETAWVTAIEHLCERYAPFPLSLTGTGNFGKRVLYIDVGSVQLEVLQHELVRAIKPYEKEGSQEDSRPFKPHLTLGRSWCGFTPHDFAAMKILAEEYLDKQPVTFDVGFLRIYIKAGHDKKYRTAKNVALK